MPEIRKDPIVDRWVIISEERASRPMTKWAMEEPQAGEDSFCPFCEGNEALTPPESFALRQNGSAPDGPGWRLRVVPNKFPALKPAGPLFTQEDGVYKKVAGVGAHEVIIETPDHGVQLAAGPAGMAAGLFHAARSRIMAHGGDGHAVCAQFFKNHGPEAGASLGHSHSQLIAMPVVSKHIKEELDGSALRMDETGRCVYCGILEKELREGARVVMENEDFAAVSPFAPRFAFETWIIPKEHAHRFELAREGSMDSLARIFRGLMGKINALLGFPPYNMMLHTAPFGSGADKSYHWHIELMPVLTRAAGFEWGSGFHINSTPPEDAARMLRETEGI